MNKHTSRNFKSIYERISSSDPVYSDVKKRGHDKPRVDKISPNQTLPRRWIRRGDGEACRTNRKNDRQRKKLRTCSAHRDGKYNKRKLYENQPRGVARNVG